jgi:ABC-2 type transport system ATP-binding protein
MYGLDKKTTLERTQELLEFMNLADEQKKLITDFSHGMQKKLALAAAVIHGPKILFLDEPFEGVDAVAAGTLKSMLQGMISHGNTIFLTSHVMEIVERLCTHIGIIHRGELIAHGSLEELRAGTVRQNAQLAFEQGHPTTKAALTLEEIFLEIVGSNRGDNLAVNPPEQELSWLK